eukprot:3514381-Pleurochrysis_carterae.AAC.1
MRALLHKSKNLMRDKHNSAGVLQADKALRALEQPRRQTTQEAREDEEQALRQMITGNLMNLARIQMKNWMGERDRHKAYVQRRWDNRGIMREALQKWKIIITQAHKSDGGEKEHKERKGNIEKKYGIKHWGRVRAIPTLHKQ